MSELKRPHSTVARPSARARSPAKAGASGRKLARRPRRGSAAKQGTVETLSRQLQRAIALDRPAVQPGSKDPELAAAQAHLRYVSEDEPGVVREAKRSGFVYRQSKTGRLLKDAASLARIKALAIPPAWQNVWICPDENGHIQAVGRDVKGRKQYRYHARWRQTRDQTKFGRMILFAEALPGIRKAVARDLGLPGLPREKVLATVVFLLATTGIRVGSDEYARANQHYGLTTLLERHVKVQGEKLRFRFKGKSGKDHDVGIRNARVARVVRRCIDIPGQRLFQYFDAAGVAHNVDSGEVNAYLHEIAGGDFTAKDFRTWVGTVTAASALLGCQMPTTVKETRAQVLAAIDAAATRLGNTRSICRASYIHPAIIEAFEEGRMSMPPKVSARRNTGLDPIEQATLRLLKAAARPPRKRLHA